MKNTVLPDLDRDTIERLKQRFPDLSAIDLPKMEEVGRTADQTIDKLLGRSRSPMWPWVALVVGLLSVVGAIAAYAMWMRQPASEPVHSTASADTDSSSTETPFTSSQTDLDNAEHTWPASETVVGMTEG
ncbi:MAG: hypothetical protein HYX55_03735 [Chloroflexi bacterium]|nr:hypothetical protein [Chloroflexota bacterium]